MRVLIVEDEADFARLLADFLQRQGYKATYVTTGKNGIFEARLKKPDCILLDWMLPDIQGSEFLRQLRADASIKHIPVIVVTARGEEVDRIVGFELGADDYVVKPVSLREIVLRIQAVTRRQHRESAGVIDVGPLKIDIGAHRVLVSGKEVPLTPLEFKLLAFLAERRGKVLSRETLLNEVWGILAEIETRTVDVTVRRLREKLGTSGVLVETVRGVGYGLSDQAGD